MVKSGSLKVVELAKRYCKQMSNSIRIGDKYFVVDKFLPLYNGISMMAAIAEWSEQDSLLASDACSTGCGAICSDQYLHAELLYFIVRQQVHINCLKLLTIVVCLKKWGYSFKDQRLIIYCDNQMFCASDQFRCYQKPFHTSMSV